MGHRRDVEAALPKIRSLEQNEIQRLHLQALLALDDTLQEILKEMRSRRRIDVVDIPGPPRPFAADPIRTYPGTDPSEDE